MKNRIFIVIITLALVAGLSQACSVSPTDADGSISTVPESGDNPFLEPGTEDGDGIVEAGDAGIGSGGSAGGAKAQEVLDVQIISDVSDLPVQGTVGDEYGEAVVEAMGGSQMGYDWTAEGLPDGLDIVPITGGKRANIEGTLDEIGTFDITITAADPNDAANSDSVTYQLVVSHTILEIDPDLVDDGYCEPIRIEMLEANDHFEQVGRSGAIKSAEMLGNESLLKFRITGGKGPYRVIVMSKVDDSYHRINEGTGMGGAPGIHQMKGISNYRYWTPGAECITPEEAADIYKRRDYSEFWPDCSDWMHLTSDETELCEKIGCSQDDWPMGAYGSPEYEHAQQCINGFVCPPSYQWALLTDGQKEACTEFNTWKIQQQQMAEHTGRPKYVCRWTKNPTWRLEGKPAPEPDSVQLAGNTFEVAGSAPVTIVSEVEFDGPLPVDRISYFYDHKYDLSKHPREIVTIMAHDSCEKPNIAKQTVSFDIKYPDENLKEFEVEILYEDMWLGGSTGMSQEELDEVGDPYKLQLYFTHGGELSGDPDIPDLEETAAATAVFNLKEIDNCLTLKDTNNDTKEKKWYNEHKEDDKICHMSADVEDFGNGGTVKDVKHLYMWLFTGYKCYSHGYWGKNGCADGDLDIEDMHIRSKYWRLDFDDDESDLFNNDVGDSFGLAYLLDDLDGMSRASVNPETSITNPFHRKPLIRNKWTY